jgi:hypothetical protein
LRYIYQNDLEQSEIQHTSGVTCNTWAYGDENFKCKKMLLYIMSAYLHKPAIVSPNSSISNALEKHNNEDITSDSLRANSLVNATPNDSLVNTFMALLENIINTKEECASHENVMKAIQSALEGDNEFTPLKI